MATLNRDADRSSTSVSLNQNIKLNVNPQPNEYNATIAQPFIIIAQDTLELRLRDYKEQIEKSRDWMAPLGILLTLVATITTATFNDKYGVSADTVQAIFITATVLTAVMLLRALYLGFTSRLLSPKEFVRSLKPHTEDEK